MEWEVVIGLETHVQLSTRSKISRVQPATSAIRPMSTLAMWTWRCLAHCRCLIVELLKRQSALA